MDNIKEHIEAALAFLTLEAWSVAGDDLSPLDTGRATLACELDRVDRALGPRGRSMFAPIAENIRGAVTELLAARAALGDKQ